MIEGSGSRAGSGSGSIHLTNGSGSGRPKNMWIRWIRIRIRIRNTACNQRQLFQNFTILYLCQNVGSGHFRNILLSLGGGGGWGVGGWYCLQNRESKLSKSTSMLNSSLAILAMNYFTNTPCLLAEEYKEHLLYIVRYRYPTEAMLSNSVRNPWHFATDPDPWIRTFD